jgi:N-acetylglutamate synthase-like GNAT family acetyltransferase
MTNETIRIRQAETPDARDIASLLFDSFEEYRHLYTTAGFDATAITPQEVLKRIEEGPVWVAVNDEAIVGTVSVLVHADSLYVRGMAVHPAARGQKVGALLLHEVERLAVDHGIKRLFLSTTPFLDRAINLYEKFGFQRVDGGVNDLFGTPLFTMEKWLSLAAPARDEGL